MKKEEKNKSFKVHSVVDPTTGAVTMYLETEEWGPVITGKDYEEAKELFIDALRSGLVLSNVFTIGKMFKDSGITEGSLKSMTQHNRQLTNTLEFA